MAQSLSQIYVHIVFSTKNRKPFLQHAPSRARLHKIPATEALRNPFRVRAREG